MTIDEEPLAHSVLDVTLDGRPMEGIPILEPLEHLVLGGGGGLAIHYTRTQSWSRATPNCSGYGSWITTKHVCNS